MNRDDDVHLLEHEVCYQGYFRLDRYRLRHRLFDGDWGPEICREVLERGHAAAVLPYDAERDEVVLIEQFRAGAYARGDQPWQLEIVAGIIGAGETPAEVARREALEEAGCTLGRRWEAVASYYMSPGAVTEYMDVYCADTTTSGLGGIHGLEAEGEDIRVHVLGYAAALEWLEAGRIHNSPAIIALQWLRLNRERLRREWQA